MGSVRDVEARELERCPICFEFITSTGEVVILDCPRRHHFCRDCLTQHAGFQRFPRCPGEGCGHELTEDELVALCGERSERLITFREDQLQRGINGLGEIVHCPNSDCACVVSADPSTRQRWQCACNWPAWCTKCRQPYHYSVACEQVQSVRQRWLEWVSCDRAAYHAEETQHMAHEEQRQALEQAMRAHAELARDEAWKQANCRECPNCGRVVQKIEGCSSMVCGENAHGGNRQSGCGHRFDWNRARGYTAVPETRSLPRLDITQVRLRGASVIHPFCGCSACNKDIVGPRFRCIHCPSFNLCSACDRTMETHDKAHVFEILFTADYDLHNFVTKGTNVLLADESNEHGFEAQVLDEVCKDVFRVQLISDQSTRVLHRSGMRVKVINRADLENHIEQGLQANDEEARRRRAERHEAIARMKGDVDICCVQ